MDKSNSVLTFVMKWFLFNIIIISSLNNYNNKMTDQKFFNGLIDFTDLRKKQEDFNSNSSKNSAFNNLDLDC